MSPFRVVPIAAMMFVISFQAHADVTNAPTNSPTNAPSNANTNAPKKHPSRACQQIAAACKQAGFIVGDWKKGDGLWRDCVDPIVQGQSQVTGATKPLPTVDPAIIADCKAHNPKFGAGKVGS